MSTQKAKTLHVCSACGARFAKWAGQCAECGAWNSLSEQRLERHPALRGNYAGAGGDRILRLSEAPRELCARHATGFAELDRVLGGGLVAGSVVLVGGDPGIGKSTLLLQVLAQLAGRTRTLYVSGEESAAQLASRAERLAIDPGSIECLTATGIERVLQAFVEQRPAVVVIDSIQTMYMDELGAAPGTVSQLRESTARLVRYAKEQGTAMILIGHVTKDGAVAGPRVLEHMVDAVLYFEGEAGSRLRVLRALKNRFGAAHEIGVFAMAERGLREVPNPSALFLAGHRPNAPGSVVSALREGTRPLLVEIQALVDQASGPPRRLAVGFDAGRLGLLLAVMHRHAELPLFDQDVYVNIVGGIRAEEPAADLAVALAVYSSFRDQAAPRRVLAFGELGLAGEVRPVAFGEERLREAAQHGFERALVARANVPRSTRHPGLEIIGVERLAEAIEVWRSTA